MITAFTIAAGLIWKDVIIEALNHVVPPQQALFYKLIAAVIATIILFTVLYTFLKTEDEAETLFRKIRKKRKR
ncbi:MAG TPA: DUF5654 family protein [Candidatus Nanoarchaeia archaeon]|nr:DUF5654 family protein [Candidatus Nanoarchaeia archaeon]